MSWYFHDYSLPLFIIAFMLLSSADLFFLIDPPRPFWETAVSAAPVSEGGFLVAG